MAGRWHPWPVDLSADLPPPRRPLFFPVVIATVFLAIIGMSAGLVLGSRHKHADNAAQGGPVVTTTTTPATPSPIPSGPLCPDETQIVAHKNGAVGQLRIQLQLDTTSSTIWICEDESGKLYYHANRGGADAPWVEGKTALFLTGVQHDGAGYAATATDGNTFSITADRLRIVHRDTGQVEVQQAVR